MDYFIGQIVLFPYTFTPMGWSLCDGKSMQILQNQALYSLIGDKFGGDGRTYFNLPNLRGAEPIPNMNYYISLMGIYPTRE